MSHYYVLHEFLHKPSEDRDEIFGMYKGILGTATPEAAPRESTSMPSDGWYPPNESSHRYD